MYAIIRDRNQQTKVSKGDVILCDLNGMKAGDKVTFNDILLVGNEGKLTIGKPLVQGASVTGEVLGEESGDKLIAFRFKRRKNVRRKRGHRQHYTQVKITGIQA
ncbi:MAG: 50S ribosomal protein L21 [Planctomycetota bacterium]|nr:50S ribosomal protein L21 [Planctomycetota bacterium]